MFCHCLSVEWLGKAYNHLGNLTKISFLDDLGKREKSHQLFPVHLHTLVRQNYYLIASAIARFA